MEEPACKKAMLSDNDVSNMTKKAKKMVVFCEDDDWAIDRKEPLFNQILDLVRKAKLKTKIHEHKGTYRLRAWMIPGKDAKQNEDSNGKVQAPTFGRPGP